MSSDHQGPSAFVSPLGKTQRKERYCQCSGGDELENVLLNGVQQEGKSPGNDLIALGSVSAPPQKRNTPGILLQGFGQSHAVSRADPKLHYPCF